ncbi:alpha/beta fold hydrolase [Nocardia sp. NBC_01329]|uniref:alpha/beta fold hydrolase n=1 Tax=Nocardia sp. NBC_01329 TaxID=2903594 RepID=UPI002E0E3310|nr:alpha/beta hydrolase [Nocardia sp. NBC_01329]
MTGDEWDDDTPAHALVCLHAGPDPARWFADQVAALGAIAHRCRPLDPADPECVDAWVNEVASAVTALGHGRVHLLATGTTAFGALALAARRPALVTGLVLGDPRVDPAAPGYDELLAQVAAPSLVIASVPDERVDIAQAQSIAGGIDNGVFVVIDGGTVPAHRERAASFNEWVTAFTIIAEGLDAMASQRQEKTNA